MLYIFDSAEKLLSILPRDNILEAIHKEVLNGENIFRFVMSASDINAEYVREGNLVAFRDLDAYWQVFEIKNITDVHSEIFTRTAYCEHIFYELLDDIVEDKRPSADATAALAGMLENTRWQAGIIDDLGVSRTSAYYISALEAVQNVANAWGGELRWRCVITGGVITRYVDLLAQRGSSTGKQFVYSKDILSIEREADSSSVVTALYGRGKGVELESGGYGRRLTFADVVAVDKPAGQEWVGNSDALEMWGRNGRHRFDVFIDEEETDAEKLLEKTRIELTKRITPRVTYRMNVVALEELAEYEHEKARIGDLVIVVDREFNPQLLVSARIIEFERDLLDISNANIILGSFAPTIVEATINTQRRVNDMANRPFNTKWLDGKISVLQNAIESALSNWWTDENGNLIFEAQDGLSAMKLAGEGLAIANQKYPDEAWNWRTFGTGNGFTADLMNTGILDAGLVQIGHATTFEEGYDPSKIVAGSTVGMGVDSDCLGLWHFDGSLNSHKGVSAIGDENFDTGCFGQAVKVEEGTTNLFVNASFSNGTTGWNIPDTNLNAEIYTEAYGSSKIVKLSKGAVVPVAWMSFRQPVVTTTNVTYTCSFKAKILSGGLIRDRIMVHWGGGNNGPSKITELNNGWHLIEYTASATTTSLNAGIGITGDTACVILITQPQFEQKDHATSFVDGTRFLGSLKAPTTGLSPSQGTISLRAKNLSVSANASVLADLPKSDAARGILAGISNVTGHEGEVFITDSPKVSKTYTETTQADFATGTLTDVVATSAGDLELATTMGKALSFDGVDDYVDIADIDLFTWTVEFLVKSSSAPGTAKTSQPINNGDTFAFSWDHNNSDFMQAIAFKSGASWYKTKINITLEGNKLYHIAATYDKSNLKVLVDGIERGSSSATVDPNQHDNVLRIGAAAGIAASFFNGIIDDVRIWNVACTQRQIQDNMNKELAGNETGLVGYWKFNEGTGTTAYDSTVNANNGTIYGATWANTPYKSHGTREKIVDLSGANPAGGTKIEWSKTTPTNTTVKVETALSTDGGSTYGAYAEATSGSSIPDITAQTDLTNARLKIKETLSTTDTSVTPKLHSLTFTIWEKQATKVYGPNKSTLTAWDSIALAWKSDRLSLVVNDAEACYIENPGLPTAFGSYLFIGTDRSGANAINTLVDELRIDKVYRDVNIRTGWHKTGVPFYTSEDMKQWPGYLRGETDGIKVYDVEEKLRAHLGSWIDGAIRKYGLKIIEGEIYSSLISTGEEGDNRGAIKIHYYPNPNYPQFNFGAIDFYGGSGKKIMSLDTGAQQPALQFFDETIEEQIAAGFIGLGIGSSTKELYVAGYDRGMLISTLNESISLGATSGVAGNSGVSISQIRGNLTPTVDGGGNLGQNNLRWWAGYIVYTQTGDLAFSEKTCAICDGKFEDGDILALLTKTILDNGYTFTIPVHERCKNIEKTIEVEVPEMTTKYRVNDQGAVEEYKDMYFEEIEEEIMTVHPDYELDEDTGRFKRKMNGWNLELFGEENILNGIVASERVAKVRDTVITKKPKFKKIKINVGQIKEAEIEN